MNTNKKMISFDWVDELGKNGGDWEADLEGMLDAKFREQRPVVEKKDTPLRRQQEALRDRYGDKKKKPQDKKNGGEG